MFRIYQFLIPQIIQCVPGWSGLQGFYVRTSASADSHNPNRIRVIPFGS